MRMTGIRKTAPTHTYRPRVELVVDGTKVGEITLLSEKTGFSKAEIEEREWLVESIIDAFNRDDR